MPDQKVFPRVSDENLLLLKKMVAVKLIHSSIIAAKAFFWLLDKTEGLTRSVAVFVPSEHDDVGLQIALSFSDMRSRLHLDSIQIVMDRIGNGFVTFSCSNRFVSGEYAEHSGGSTFRISAREVNPDEVEIPFDLAAIMATPLSQ